MLGLNFFCCYTLCMKAVKSVVSGRFIDYLYMQYILMLVFLEDLKKKFNCVFRGTHVL